MRALAESGPPGALGCTQVTEILYTPGLALAGPLPEPFGLSTVYAAGRTRGAAEPALAAGVHRAARRRFERGRASRRRLRDFESSPDNARPSAAADTLSRRSSSLQMKSSYLPAIESGRYSRDCTTRIRPSKLERLAQGVGERLFLRRGQRFDRDELELDVVERMLDDLVLLDRRDLVEGLEAGARQEAAAVGLHQQVALAAEDAPQGRQGPAAGARAADLGIVADVVAQHRRGEVVQVGHHHPADLALDAGRPSSASTSTTTDSAIVWYSSRPGHCTAMMPTSAEE
jgi:hypothetical protein